MPQYVVKSTLSTVRSPWFKTLLEQLVQKVSELDCRGNAVFTLALLRARTKYGVRLPQQFTSQTFINLCLRAVASSNTLTCKYPELLAYVEPVCVL